jgi:hypothetical protein
MSKITAEHLARHYGHKADAAASLQPCQIWHASAAGPRTCDVTESHSIQRR